METTRDDTPSFNIELSPHNSQSPTTPQPPEETHDLYKTLSLPREIGFVIVICFAQLLTQSGLAQVLVPLYYVGGTFSVVDNLGELSWFLAAYSLTVGTFILIAGRLGDMYGHKLVFSLGFLWFGLWSLVTGFSAYSKSIVFFDICRALQGIGPAFTLPSALAILARVYPEGKRKHMVFSAFAAAAPNGFLVGALFSAIFAQFAWWPWGFWVMGIVCFVVTVIGYFLIPDVDEEIKRQKNKPKFDFFGAISGVAGLVLVNFAWNQGPVVGWNEVYVYVILIIGVLCLGVFVYVEHKAEQPLVPPRIFNLEVMFVLICIAFGWASFGIWVFYFWQFLEVLRGYSPLMAFVQFIPVGISGGCAALTSGFLLSRVPTTVLMTIAMVGFTVGSILIATAPVDQTYWAQSFVAVIVTPWGMDMSFPSATILLSRSMPREDQGIAASLVNTVVNYAISIGLGIAGTVVYYTTDPTDVLGGYRAAWYTGIGFAGTGIVVSLLSVVYMYRESQKGESSSNVA